MTEALIELRPPKHRRSQASAAAGDILVVEDNAVNQILAQEFLALMGLRSRIASNGHEALQACLERAPELVLMDIQMPLMDGLECTRRLRGLQERDRLPHFPILALTANCLAEDVGASRAAGMDEHLSKPLDFQALAARLEHWLSD